MRDLDEEPALLAAVGGLLGQFDGVVTYNGGGFDLPLLETRFVLARRRLPDDVFHLDLLGSARRLWSTRLADCRLGTLERHVLGFTRDDDLPGALIPSAYFDYLRRKQPGALPRIFEHNRHDILSLAALTGWVAGAVARAPVPDLASRGAGRAWPHLGRRRRRAGRRLLPHGARAGPGKPGTGARPPAAGRRREAPRPLGRGPRLLGGGHQRRSRFDPRPWEEIAKVHEHRRRDLPAARALVEAALTRGRQHGAPDHILASFTHRLDRLTRRLAPKPKSSERRQPRALRQRAPGRERQLRGAPEGGCERVACVTRRGREPATRVTRGRQLARLSHPRAVGGRGAEGREGVRCEAAPEGRARGVVSLR